MNPFARAREVLRGVAHAFRFDNPFEYLVNWHLLRRRDPFVLCHSDLVICVNAESSDVVAVTEVFLQGMYDEAILAAARGRSAFCYLNLGANIGAFDLRVARLVDVPTSGLSVEMNPFAHARLLLNLELNRLGHVRTLHAGASSGPGHTRLSVGARDTGQQLPPPGRSEGWPVPLVGWREVLAALGDTPTVDLLKVDIEGSEADFLGDFAEAARRRVRNAIIESHGPQNHAAVVAFLREAGFVVGRDQESSPATRLVFATNPALGRAPSPPPHSR